MESRNGDKKATVLFPELSQLRAEIKFEAQYTQILTFNSIPQDLINLIQEYHYDLSETLVPNFIAWIIDKYVHSHLRYCSYFGDRKMKQYYWIFPFMGFYRNLATLYRKRNYQPQKGLYLITRLTMIFLLYNVIMLYIIRLRFR